MSQGSKHFRIFVGLVLLVGLSGVAIALGVARDQRPSDLAAIDAAGSKIRPLHDLLSTFVLNLLKPRRPDDAVAVLALTTEDLWPGKGWNFVFGQASLGERVGVWSTHRLCDREADSATCLRRTLKTALHETGHMLGIPHCTLYECCMNGSNHQAESDSRPMGFCPECEMKIWWACRVDPVKRYQNLAEFADVHGLKLEADFWRKSREVLK
jgi:archaemetzincin